MGKPRYVEATLDGYYGGKRVAGSKFWLADGKAEFSKKWMKDAKPSSDDPEPAPLDGGSEAEQKEQIAQLTKNAEAAEAKAGEAEAERDAAKDELTAVSDKLLATEAERDSLRAQLDASAEASVNPAKPGGSSDKGGSGAKA